MPRECVRAHVHIPHMHTYMISYILHTGIHQSKTGLHLDVFSDGQEVVLIIVCERPIFKGGVANSLYLPPNFALQHGCM